MYRPRNRLFLALGALVVAVAFLANVAVAVEAGAALEHTPAPPPRNDWWSRFKSAFTFGQQTECVFRSKDHVYDFTKLHKTVGAYSGKEGAYKYEMNVCGLVTSNPICRLHYSSICQYSNYNNRFIASLGSWEGNPKPQWGFIDESDPSKGVQLTYRNGERCNIGAVQMPRVTNVQFVCSDVEAQEFTVQTNSPTCETTIRLPTPLGCGAGGASSFGSTLKRWFFYFIVIALVYVAAGCFYNVEYNGKQWGQLDAIPNYEFWLTVPGHVKTGFEWSVEKAKTLWNRDAQGYEQFKPGETKAETASADDDGLSGL